MMPPPPGVLDGSAFGGGGDEAAAGYFAGANLQAGWNHGAPPYGPWAVANPMVQYAHAAQHRHGFDWE